MTTKPLAGARPREGHPFTFGLRHAFLFNERAGRMITDCVTSMHGFFRTGEANLQWFGTAIATGWSNTIHGCSVLFSGAEDIGNFDKAVFARTAGEGSFSIVMGCAIGNTASWQTLWGAGANDGLYVNPSGRIIYYPFGAGHTLTSAEFNLPHVVSVTWKNDVLSYMFDGVDDIGVVSAVNAKLVATNTIGGHTAEFLYGQVSFLYIYDRFIAPSLMAQIHRDPFAAFTPLRVYVPGAAAASGTAKHRRSLSALGTRMGVRQVQP